MASEVKERELLASSLEEFTRAADGWKDIYAEGLEDLYFVAGDQWPEDIKNERAEAGRPVLTFNKQWKFIKKVQGNQKQNRPRIKVLPANSKASVPMAEIFQDIIRHIEEQSVAEVVYDTGFNQCLASSVGFWRVVPKYEDGETFDQCLRIELIPNQFSVLFDPKAKDPMFTDARYVYISTWLSEKEFKHKYPNAENSSWPTEGAQDAFEGWWEEGKVRVAEKYYKKIRKVSLALLSTGETIQINDEIRGLLREQGIEIEKERVADIEEIWWCKMSGAEILEGPTKHPGKYFPIVPVLGDIINLEGKSRIFSLIRHAKDPQRMYNYFRTAEVETVAMMPKTPYILTAEQIENYEKYWREAASSNKPFLVYNHIDGQPRPQREPPPSTPTGAFSQSDRADADIFETIGINPPSLGERSNERSGKALAMRERSSDTAVFGFFDSHARSIAHTGKVLVDLIPHIYDTERIILIEGDDKQLRELVVNKVDVVDFEEVVINDLTDAGQYNVVLAAGASYQTKRQEMAEFLQNSLQYAPDYAPVLIPELMKNIDAPGAQEMAEKLYALMPPEMKAALQGGIQGQPGTPAPQAAPVA